MLWRINFILYALVLTAATHWPRLNLGSLGGRSPDKVLHFVAFGTLTLMLWRTNWFRWRWLVMLIALTWAGVDEISQGFFAIERTVSWHDYFASASGVLIASAWLWSLAPVGGPANRLRLQRWHYASDRVLNSVPSLALIAGAGVAGLAVGLLIDVLFHAIDQEPSTSDARLVTMLITMFVGMHTAFLMLRQRAALRVLVKRTCYACHQGVAKPTVDAYGMGTCDHCGATFNAYQWIPAPRLASAKLMRLGILPVILAASLLALGFVAFLGLMRLAIYSFSVHNTVRGFNEFEPELLLVLDLAYMLFAVAIAARFYRQRLARLHDQQALVCMHCGHDLHATPDQFGMGTCGECGMRFVRLPEGNDSPQRH